MVRISRFEVENVKRVQAVQVEPSPNGLTVIGGRNGQGKTSILDAILWALGGNKYKPTEAKRNDSSADPRIQIEMDNGLVVIREGKNASLKVIDQHGNKAGQTLLDELIGQLALDLPKFLNGSGKDKAETLLQIIGVGPQLAKFDQQVEKLYNERHLIGQQYTRKLKHAEDLPFEQGVPDEEVSAGELIQQQQAILGRNGEKQRLRNKRDDLAKDVTADETDLSRKVDSVREAETKLAAARTAVEAASMKLAETKRQYAIASQSVTELIDESTSELEKSLQQIDDTNGEFGSTPPSDERSRKRPI